jgi:hypothetical protein
MEQNIKETADGRKTITVEDLKRSLANSVQLTSGNVAGLQNSLKMYSDAMNDYVALKMEHQGILDKYISKSTGTANSAAYNLPGVFATSMAVYDVNAAKADNKRVMELNDLIIEAERQKDYYYDNLVTCFNDLVGSLQKLKKYDGAIIEYLVLMQQEKAL